MPARMGQSLARRYFMSPVIPIIIGIPPHDIMQGMPMAIIAFMAFMRSVIMPMAD
ncbi:MAG TPA: hypothetical protein VFP65_04145 [Anaeromyxobacteraceae bacterium]|nr:hypothetical protein [Anaeromyxobacteraceae bacterium]